MLKAKNVMRPKPIRISLSVEITQCILFFKENNISSVLVATNKKKIHGILTEVNLLKIFLKHQSQVDKLKLMHYLEYLEPVQFINENESFYNIIHKLTSAINHEIFVINSDCEVIGSISPRDVLPVLSHHENFFTQVSSKIKKKKDRLDLQKFIQDIEALRSELYFYESFFTYSPYMMHSSTPEGLIRMANVMLHNALGYEPGELIGKTIFDIYPIENHEKAREGMKKILKSGYHHLTKAQMVKKNKKILDVEMASQKLLDPLGKPIGSITVSRASQPQELLEALSHTSQIPFS